MKKVLKLTLVVAVVAVMCVALVACIPSDYSKAVSNLKDEGYVTATDTVVIPTALKLAGVEGIETVITGTNGSDAITLIYFESSSAAKSAYDAVKEYFTNKDGETAVNRSGKVIYCGTDAAVKAAK